MHAASIAVIATTLGALGGCNTLSARFTREGMLAIGPRNAAVAGQAGTEGPHDDANPPERHVSRSAFDTWRPPPLGVLPPGMVLHNTSVPVQLVAGNVALTLRSSDRLVPAWGGDVYVRVDLLGGGAAEQVPPRDLVVLVDTREASAVARARRIAASLFETLHGTDRGALIATTGWGQVLVPLMPAAAGPLLIERARALEVRGGEDLASAVGRAVPMLAGHEAGRIRRLVVLSGSGEFISGEARQWIEVALRLGAEVRLAPLLPAASRRFEALSAVTDAIALPVLPTDDAHEREAIEELSALPPARLVAEDMTLVVESLPGPLHLIEVSGATPIWTPSGGEVPLGEVRAGEARTVVLRGRVPAWRPGAEYELALRVRYRDDGGAHEVGRIFHARYSGSPSEQAGSRAGDVLQYVSLLNTMSRFQAALARHDMATLLSVREPAALQARSLQYYAREHHDPIMLAQAELMLDLLAAAPTVLASGPPR
jgi:hypothetical protein